MKIRNYAPVLIPTLNRYEHFKRCLESLEMCTGAEYTDVYVALDYPPSEMYIEGWKRIDEYLKEKEAHNGFKSLNVTRRERNYGVCHENANLETLIKEIEKIYDRHIDSEDDNEFSPNFLDFINKGLEKFKDDDRIMMISGYSYPNVAEMNYKSNVIAFRKAAAWGAGFWREKQFTYKRMGDVNYRDCILNSLKESMKLFRLRPISLNSLISMKFRGRVYGDGLMIDCLLLENKYCVFPKLSKVRNWGQDGSGAHSGIVKEDYYSRQEIDSEHYFYYKELEISNIIPFEGIDNCSILERIKTIIMPFVVLVRYLFYRILGIDIFAFYFERRGKEY